MNNELALNDERWKSQRGNETRNEVKDYTAGSSSNRLRSVKSESQKTFLPYFLTLFFLFFVRLSIWCLGGKFHSLFLSSLFLCFFPLCLREDLHFDVLDKKFFLPYFRSTLASFVAVSLLYSSFLFIALLRRVGVFVNIF